MSEWSDHLPRNLLIDTKGEIHMAQLTQTPQSKSNRPRVQFSMSRELFTTYQQIQSLAEEHRITIDFRRDFEEWFSNQLNQIMQQLATLNTKEAGADTAEPVELLPGGEEIIPIPESQAQYPQAETN
jgi:hypothetical protein